MAGTALIARTTRIEDLLAEHPEVVGVFVHRGIPCLVCGEPVWGTVEETALNAGVSADAVDGLIADLNSQVEGANR
jgi:hypothetical protein